MSFLTFVFPILTHCFGIGQGEANKWLHGWLAAGQGQPTTWANEPLKNLLKCNSVKFDSNASQMDFLVF